jgi:predicted RNA-binding Zn ribbon-like protein
MAASAEVRDGFKFRSDHLALDLPATLAGRLRPTPTDLLQSPADLERWLVVAGVASRRPDASDANLFEARRLRESLYRLAVCCVREERFAPADLAVVNRMALVSPPAPQLGARGLTWKWDDVSNLLAVVARAGAELFGGDAAQRIRACSGEGCSILFLDGSRAGDRRWCSMAACGNRAKLAEFRKRQVSLS